MPKKSFTVDVAVIGAGSGGMTVAIGLGKIGKSVVLIEKGEIGGDCTNYGCVPSKTLIHQATEKDREAPLRTVRAVIKDIQKEEHAALAELKSVQYLRGAASFRDAHTLEVASDDNTTTVKAERIVIATGSSPRTLEIPGLPDELVQTNETIFYQKELPKSIVIIGSGVIACELALALAQLGCSVTLLNRGTSLLKEQLPQVQQALERVFEEAKIRCIWDATDYTYEGGSLCYMQDSKKKMLPKPDAVLPAVGRVPNTASLQLDHADIEYDKHGIVTDDTMHTTQSHIFAIGDVTHKGGLTHIANAQGRQVVQQIAFPLLPVGALGSIPQAIFTEPNLAVTGCSAQEAQKLAAQGLVQEFTASLPDSDRGKTDALSEGFISIFAYRVSGKIAHVTILSPAAGEMISFFTLAIEQGISLWKIRNVIFPYPTLLQVTRQLADQFCFGTLKALPSEVNTVAGIRIKHFFAAHWRKVTAAVFWIAVIIGMQWYLRATGTTAGELLTSLVSVLRESWYGPLLYGLVYLVRPLVLFPASIITALAGAVWGIRDGVLYATIAATLSSLIPYGVGRWFGASHTKLPGALGRFEKLLSKNGFESTLAIRLFYVPYDVGSFIAGFVKVPIWQFLAATVLGSVFGTLTFVSIGATIDLEKLSMGMFDVKSDILLQSILLGVGGIVVSRVLKYLFTRFYGSSEKPPARDN